MHSYLQVFGTARKAWINYGLIKRLYSLIACCALLGGCGGGGDPTTTTTTTIAAATTTIAAATTTIGTGLLISEQCVGYVTQYLQQISPYLANADLSQTVVGLEATTAGAELSGIASQFQQDNPCSYLEMGMLTIPVVREFAQGDPQTEQFLDYVEDNEAVISARDWNLYPICGGL